MTHEHSVSVRPADAGDTADLAVLRRAWAEELAGQPLEDAGFEERFSRWHDAETGRRITFLAEIHSIPVGTMNLAIFERMPRPGRTGSRWGYLGNAFVLAAHRNQGIGGALLDALVAEADGRGCVRIVLSPSDRSVPFYERAGFEPASMLRARVHAR